MAIIARQETTITFVVDIKETYRYYLLQDSALAAPTTPTTYPPNSKWSLTEPSYSEGSTDNLYVVECTVFTNDTFSYSNVSLSSSYEASKAAYTKAVEAKSSADSVENTVKTMEVGGTNLLLNTASLAGSNIIISEESLSEDTYKGLAVVHKDNSTKVSGYDDILEFRDIYPDYLGQTYTLSFYAKGSGTSKLQTLFYGSSGYLQVETSTQSNGVVGTSYDGNTAWTLTDDWKRYWVTWALKSSGDISVEKYVLFRLQYGGVASVCGVQLELGNKATDWSPSPDDTNNAVSGLSSELRSVLTEQTASIRSDTEYVIMEALKSYTLSNDFADFQETVSSQLKLLSDSMTLQFQQTTEELSSVNNDLQEKYSTITKYFTFDINGMTIGQTDNPYKVVIDNDEYYMTVNGEKVMWIKNGKVYTPDIEITNGFKLLGYLIEKDSSGNVNCGYVGG